MVQYLRNAKRALYCAPCAIVLGLSQTAIAQTSPQNGSQQAVALGDIPAEILLQGIRRNRAREQYISNMVRPVRDLDKDNSGLSQADIDRNDTIARTSDRAQNASSLLRNDYNGDLQVDVEEILQFVVQQDKDQARRGAERTVERFDVDGDGIATLQEAISIIPSYRRRNRQNDQLKQLLALDPNGDGALTSQELVTIAGATFDRFDRDGNGLIDEAEEAPVKQARQIASDRARLKDIGCNFPKISPEAQFVAFGTYSASVPSGTYVGRPDFVTGIADVEIEAGKAPVYLLLGSFRPTIWRFSGATDRVEHVIVGSEKTQSMDPDSGARPSDAPRTSAAGVVGLDKSKVSIAPIGCFKGSHRASEERRQHADAIAFSVGKSRADRVRSEGNVYHVSAPSFTTKRPQDERPGSPVPGRYQSRLWQDVLRGDFPKVVNVDPGKVVSAEPAAPYEVLPNPYGIAQMVEQGILAPDDQNRMVIKETFPHWPANMPHGRSVAFIASADVTLPEQGSSRACVLTPSEANNDGWKTICDTKLRPPPPSRPIPTGRSRPARPPAASPTSSSAPVSQARAAVPRNEVRWIVRILDGYPAQAKREGIEGIVGISATVTERGRATNCQVTSSSGSKLLDEAPCKGLLRYARFDPALDRAGNPTTGTYRTRIGYETNR